MEDLTNQLSKFVSENPKVQYIRLYWVDYTGILRTRFLPVKRCLQLARGGEEYLIPQVSMILPLAKRRPNFPPGHDIETWSLVPDWTSLRVCGFKPNHASVMCFVKHREAQDPFGKCPRMLLYRAWKKLGLLCHQEALAGFEIEFMVLDGEHSQPLEQLDRLTSYQTTAGLRSEILEIVEEVISCLEISGVEVHHFHTETRDQIEIALSPESPLRAVDSLIIAQETIRTVFVQHGLKATMTPRPVLGDGKMDAVACPSNGIHMHLSVKNMPAPATDHFLAGILEHTSSLCAFGMASHDSNIRLRSDGVGEWIGFGTENRDLPVRQVTAQHWELRMLDATANPYLFAGASIFAGILGVEKSTALTWQDCRAFPRHLSPFERKRHHLVERMPVSLADSIILLEMDDYLKKYVSGDLIGLYTYVKRMEVDWFADMGDAERRAQFLEFF